MFILLFNIYVFYKFSNFIQVTYNILGNVFVEPFLVYNLKKASNLNIHVIIS